MIRDLRDVINNRMSESDLKQDASAVRDVVQQKITRGLRNRSLTRYDKALVNNLELLGKEAQVIINVAEAY